MGQRKTREKNPLGSHPDRVPCLNIAKLKVAYVDKGEPPIGMSLKEALQALANTLGLEIRVAHSPPYCSNHDPIEHRLFSHITHACFGVALHSVDIAKQFMAKANICTGLKVTVDILTGVYGTGKKCSDEFLENMKIIFDDHLPRWNYRATPSN